MLIGDCCNSTLSCVGGHLIASRQFAFSPCVLDLFAILILRQSCDLSFPLILFVQGDSLSIAQSDSQALRSLAILIVSVIPGFLDRSFNSLRSVNIGYFISSCCIAGYIYSICACCVSSSDNISLCLFDCVSDILTSLLLVEFFPCVSPLILFVEGNLCSDACLCNGFAISKQGYFNAVRSDAVLVAAIFPRLCYCNRSLSRCVAVCNCYNAILSFLAGRVICYCIFSYSIGDFLTGRLIVLV